MMTSSNGNIFRSTGPLVRGIHRSPVNSPHTGQWRGAFMFLWSAPWINGWANNREAGDLRHHHAHYNVTVMWNLEKYLDVVTDTRYRTSITRLGTSSHTLEIGRGPDSKVHEANMGPIWRRQDPCGPHVGPMNFAIWGRGGGGIQHPPDSGYWSAMLS